jgi:hypothetical protein
VRPEVEASTRAVTAGTADDGDDAVVALLMDGFAYCTGTAIAPRVVVTAAHCIHEGNNPRGRNADPSVIR